MYQLILGDVTEKIKSIPDNSIRIIVTSPPYNKTGFRGGKTGNAHEAASDMAYGLYDDNLDEKTYWDWQRDLFNEYRRILMPDGSLFYNHKVRRNNGKAHHPMMELVNVPLTFYQQITWDKCGGFDKNLGYLDIDTELIFWFVKDKPFVGNKNKIQFRGEIWRAKYSGGIDHPAPFPIEIPRNAILLASKEGDTVFDPFLGSGTVAVASIQTERNFIGFEIDPNHIKTANERVELELARMGRADLHLSPTLSVSPLFV